jgi:ribulose-phosphate 3-epimerase
MRLYPSLAASPQISLGDTVRELEQAGVDALHFDLEDGSFVHVMTLGTKVISDLRPLTILPFDVHLMMVNPEWIVPELARAGANRLSVHYEACLYPRRVLRVIHDLGIEAGLAFNPATPMPDLGYLTPYLRFILLLTTEPELPNPVYLPQVLEKVRQNKAHPGYEGLEWVVDGGLDVSNLGEAAAAGADAAVIGRAFFLGGDLKGNAARLRAASQTS